MSAISCCFIGQKLLTPSDRLTSNIRAAITDLVKRGVTDFYSGGETGFDLLCAKIVTEIRAEYHGLIRLDFILPCPNWINIVNRTMEQRRIFIEVFGEADGLETVSPIYHSGCTAKRNERLIQCADICLYLPEESNSDGTSQLIETARAKGLDMIEIGK